MNWTINQSEIACQMPKCNPEAGWSIWQYLGDSGVATYQGWFFLIFVVIGFIAILFALFLIAVEYGAPKKTAEEKKDLEPRSKGKRK